MPDPRVILDGERHALDLLKQRFPSGSSPVIFDVGANVGDYAREVLGRMPGAHLWCFEPQPDAMVELAKWVETFASAADGHAIIVPLALSDKAGPMTLRATDTACCYLAGLYREHDAPSGLAVDRPVEAMATTLDSYCALVELDRINLLKIDTEGHEPWVLDGATGMLLDGKIDLIQFEMADVSRNAGWTFKEMWLKLTSLDYDLYLEHADRLELLGPEAPLDDLVHYVNILAVAGNLDWWA